MEKYKILFISPHVDNYGAEKSLVTLMKWLQDSGHQVYLIIPQHGKIEELLIDYKLNFSIVKFYQWTNVGQGTRLCYGIGKYIYNKIATDIIIEILKKIEFKPDIIHVNVIGTELGVHLKRRLKSKLVWHIREMGIQDFNCNFDFGDTISSHIMKKCDRFIAISEAVRENYLKLISADKIVCIYNGIAYKEYVEPKPISNRLRLILVGRLSEEKGQEEAILAIKCLILKGYMGITLDLYGDGVDRKRILKVIYDNGLKNHVALKGYVEDIDYSNYDVGLMCSRCEAFGRVTVEYMMNSLPVIGANTGATVELLSGGAGLLYEKGSWYSLASMIEKLFNDEYERLRIGLYSYKKASNHYTIDQYCKNIENTYINLMEDNNCIDGKE